MAGKGTRLRPLTNTRPKALIPIANEYLIDHILSALDGLFDGLVFVVNYKMEMIMDHVSERYPDTDVTYMYQENVSGTADAVLSAGELEEPFLCINGDVFIERECIVEALALFRASGKQVISVKRMENDGRYGSVLTCGGVLEGISEKEPSEEALVNIGVYVFKPEIFQAIRETPTSVRGEYELTDSIISLKDDFVINEYGGYWNDIGYPWSVLEVNEHIVKDQEMVIEGNIEERASFSGNIQVGKGTIVRNGAYIIGPVRIGRDCDIGPNCFIRPYTTIGDNCHVGNATEIKNSILFNRTNAAHLSYVGDSIIGENCNLGAGTLVANLRHKKDNISMEINGKMVSSGRRKLGMVMGDNSKTGINVSIYEGRVIGNDSGIGPGVILKRNVEPNSIVLAQQETTTSIFRKD
ncbi:MAG TPA: sugar phosphate nucleotidyltransferase [Candidatus Methanofastidiosa archaeon]|nr:sugar phosphate nucleotidyltransferase [Candidatus Methanofastidiosa archaeon]